MNEDRDAVAEISYDQRKEKIHSQRNLGETASTNRHVCAKAWYKLVKKLAEDVAGKTFEIETRVL